MIPGAPITDHLDDPTARHILRAVFTGAPATSDTTPTDSPRWLIADFTDGRITGVNHGNGWIRSDQLTRRTATPPFDPDSGPTWRVWTVRLFDPTNQVLIRATPDGYTGWRTTEPTQPDNPAIRPRDRAFLLGVDATATAVPTPEADHHFTLLRERDGRETLVPLAFQSPTPARDNTTDTAAGTWLRTREYFTADPATGAVGVTAHRYLDLTTGEHPGPRP